MQMPFKLAYKEFNGLTFGPKWNTVFTIEFLDVNDQKIGFDVYGGKSDNQAS